MHVLVTNTGELTYTVSRLKEMGYQWKSGNPMDSSELEDAIKRIFAQGQDVLLTVNIFLKIVTWEQFQPNVKTALDFIGAITN